MGECTPLNEDGTLIRPAPPFGQNKICDERRTFSSLLAAVVWPMPVAHSLLRVRLHVLELFQLVDS